jgi:hypothetical protein
MFNKLLKARVERAEIIAERAKDACNVLRNEVEERWMVEQLRDGSYRRIEKRWVVWRKQGGKSWV